MGGNRTLLPGVTLCSAASVNVGATAAAIRASLSQVDVEQCLLFTERGDEVSDPRITVVPVAPITSSRAYSLFMLHELSRHVQTDFCLVVQWDGFVLDGAKWDVEFFSYDYIGAPWPQFEDGRQVGNGGFSLRSRRLLAACADPDFAPGHPEDVAICRTNRSLLESKYGIRFAPPELAARFSVERSGQIGESFGFHGAFHMVDVLGPDGFWEIYESLDDRQSIFTDFAPLFRKLGRGWAPSRRRARLLRDRLLTN